MAEVGSGPEVADLQGQGSSMSVFLLDQVPDLIVHREHEASVDAKLLKAASVHTLMGYGSLTRCVRYSIDTMSMCR